LVSRFFCFLIALLWICALVVASFAPSLTRIFPTTSLFSLLTKPRADQQAAALQRLQESADRRWNRVMRLWPLAAASFVAAIVLLAAAISK